MGNYKDLSHWKCKECGLVFACGLHWIDKQTAYGDAANHSEQTGHIVFKNITKGA